MVFEKLGLVVLEKEMGFFPLKIAPGGFEFSNERWLWDALHSSLSVITESLVM